MVAQKWAPFRLPNLKIRILGAFAAAVLIILSINSINDRSSETNSRDTSSLVRRGNNQSRSYKILKKNIFFLKTHKTASSTVQNIILRFGLRHSLNFMLSKEGMGPYLGYWEPPTLEHVDNETIPQDGKFNIFTQHTRYRSETNRFLYPDVVRVTILRDPAEVLESIYGFCNFERKLQTSWADFVDSLPHPKNFPLLTAPSRSMQGRNQMSRDLGLEIAEYESDASISRFIGRIDQQFHLVMIQDYLEASLVLLADLMGWPLHYVTSLKLNARQEELKNNLTDGDRLKILQYCRADYLLYRHFMAKFRARVLEYGVAKLASQVQQLHSMNSELEERCILRQNKRGVLHTVSYDLKNNSDMDCVLGAMLEIPLTDRVRQQQISRLKLVEQLGNLVDPSLPNFQN